MQQLVNKYFDSIKINGTTVKINNFYICFYTGIDIKCSWNWYNKDRFFSKPKSVKNDFSLIDSTLPHRKYPPIPEIYLIRQDCFVLCVIFFTEIK